MRLIDAAAFWDNFNDELEMGVSDPGEAASNALDATPTVDAEPVRHGQWVHHYFDSGEKIDDNWYCSQCAMCGGKVRSWHCPNCGAKMDEVSDGEI